MPATLRCPICKKEVAFNDPEMPFCSKRCRLIDIGNWADERYTISTPTYQNELEEEAEEREGQ
jgi:endogenous inhibitor of DNA gyrase (YacG/DUF329 family)